MLVLPRINSEPSELQLASQLEYDMDEQDRAWLEIINKQRKADCLPLISYQAFERCVDVIEKQWFELVFL